MHRLALTRGGYRYELLRGRHRSRSFGRGGTRCDAGFLSMRCRGGRRAALTPFAAVAAAAPAALALLIAFPRGTRSCLGGGWGSVFLWAPLPRVGPFPG